VMARGQTVTVFTSNGALASMPDVVSSAPTAAAAEQTLASAGFTSVTEKCVKLAPTDTLNDTKVVSSNPAPGTVVRLTDPVTLGVGRIAC